MFQAQKLLGQENKLQLDSKKHLKAKRASLKDTRVSRFKMPYKI